MQRRFGQKLPKTPLQQAQQKTAALKGCGFLLLFLVYWY
jgi:hypothetical protein